MFVETGAVISVAKAAYKHRGLLGNIPKRVWLWVRRGTVRVQFFGPGGVGKTSLAMLLAGTFDRLKPQQYRESLEVEKHNIQDRVTELSVLPGQQRRRTLHRTELIKKLEKGAVKGLVHVVSWGYHSIYGLSYKDFPISDHETTPEEFLKKYLEQQRTEEIGTLDELRQSIIDAPNKLWMVTAVTKQDLWWDDRRQVQQYYMNGKYDAIIRHIADARGADRFIHEYVSLSLVINNFYSGTGELLKQTAAGYDQSLQSGNIEQCFRVVESLIQRTKRRRIAGTAKPAWGAPRLAPPMNAASMNCLGYTQAEFESGLTRSIGYKTSRAFSRRFWLYCVPWHRCLFGFLQLAKFSNLH